MNPRVQDIMTSSPDFGYYNSYKNFLTEGHCRHISKVILRDEEHILRIPNPFPNDYKGLTRQHTIYNWLTHPELAVYNLPRRIHTTLTELNKHPKILIQCWANILRQGENLLEHTHGNENTPYPFYAINIFLSGNPTTGTYYYAERQNIPNEVGELVILNDQTLHGVPTNLFQKPRISMALDIYTHPEHIEILEEDIKNGVVSSERFIPSYL